MNVLKIAAINLLYYENLFIVNSPELLYNSPLK